MSGSVWYISVSKKKIEFKKYPKKKKKKTKLKTFLFNLLLFTPIILFSNLISAACYSNNISWKSQNIREVVGGNKIHN